MKKGLSTGLMLVCLAVAGGALRARAQSAGNGSDSRQNQPPGSADPPAAQSPSRGQQQSIQNPFPEDTSDVPIVPSPSASGNIPGFNSDGSRLPVPVIDVDPVRSPEDASSAAENAQQTSSSSLAGMRDLLPSAGENAQPGKHGRGDDEVPEHQETAAEDESVGKYYLDNKDWKAALSRYQSALVLDPLNPEVYWCIAESERNLADYANARANYRKVIEYDPDSHRAKQARKALEDPRIANASASQAQPAVTAPQ